MNDLNKFKKLFGHDVARERTGKLEYRVKGELDHHKATAAEVINKNKLNLKVSSSGNMAQLKAFEIVEA